VEAGTLQFNGAAARNPVLNSAGRTSRPDDDLRLHGRSRPAGTIGALPPRAITVAAASHFDLGKFQALLPMPPWLGLESKHEPAGAVAYTLYGDASLNGSVDISDLSALAQNWNGSGMTWSQGDFKLRREGGPFRPSGVRGTLEPEHSWLQWRHRVGLRAVVPEPATGILLLAALATFFFARRQKRLTME